MALNAKNYPALTTIALLLLGLPGLATSQSDSIRVTLLGTGAPLPDPARFGAATLIEAGSQKLLFDAGRGVTIRLNQIARSMREISAVFITHFHSDHLMGLADLWLTSWLPPNFGQRTVPLRVIGPTGTSNITSGLASAYAADIAIRIVDERRTGPVSGHRHVTRCDRRITRSTLLRNGHPAAALRPGRGSRRRDQPADVG